MGLGSFLDIARAIVDPIGFTLEQVGVSTASPAQLVKPIEQAIGGDVTPLITTVSKAAVTAAAVSAGVPLLPIDGAGFQPTDGEGLGVTELLGFARRLGFAPTEKGELSGVELVTAALRIAQGLGGLTGVVDKSVGGRLAELAGTHGNLLQTVLAQIFPELGKLTTVLGQVAGKQLPGAGRALGRQTRYSGVRLSTIERMGKLGMLPLDYTAEILREGSPPADPDDVPSITGVEGLSTVGGEEAGAVATGHGAGLIAGALDRILTSLVQLLFEGGRQLVLFGREQAPVLVDAMSTVGRDLFGNLALTMVEGVKGRLERHGPVRPGEQGPLYADLIGQAATAGIGAHLTASALELLMPLKHLGLPQIAALMADLAGFGLLTNSQLGPLVRAGIGRPAEYEANRIFKSQLPDLGTAKQFVLERIIGLDDYREILRFAGYTEEWVERYVQEVWEEPTLRELSTVVDDNPVDEAWLRRKVTETGLEDRDVDLFVAGLTRRSLKGFRAAYLSELVSAHRDGLLTEEELEGELSRLELPDAALDLVRRRARLQQRRELVDLAERGFRDLAAEQVLTPDDYRLALQGLGVDEQRIRILTGVVEARVRGRVAREERADIKAAMREEQRVRVQAAQEAFRREQISEEGLLRIFTGLGFEERQADAMVALAAIRQAPVPRAPVALTAEAQRERENALIRDAALVAFREGKVDEAALVRILSSLGIVARELEALVTLELARKEQPKPVIVREDPAAVRARQLKTEAAIQEFRQGKISLELLRQRLLAAGHPPVVVEGFLEREQARIPPAA